MDTPCVYLAGPIAGVTYSGATDWRQRASELLRRGSWVDGLSPMRDKDYLSVVRGNIGASPIRNYPLSTDDAITTRDRLDIKNCDVVLVYLLGAASISIGTCIELGFAAAYDKPVVLVMEPEGNLHDHPMVRSIGKFKAATLEEGVKLAKSIIGVPSNDE